MTDYQRIENELLSLGWQAENGRGDHVKFTKPGGNRTLVISHALSSANRSWGNTLALIRREEPGFTIGRPVPKKKTERDGQPQKPDNLPDWMAPGQPVRWTAPEKRDYSKLDDTDSVMNQKYFVLDYLFNSELNLYTLRIGQDEEHSFLCGPEDIDAWEIKACDHCHRRLPINRLATTADGKQICASCANEILKQNKPETAKEQNAVKEKSNPLFGLSPELDNILQEMQSRYGGMAFTDLPPEDQEYISEKTREAIKTLNSKGRKLLAKAEPALYSMVQETQEVKVTPYQAWRKYITDQLIDFMLLNPELKPQYKDYNRLFYQTSYRIAKLKTPKGCLDVIEVTAKDWTVLLQVWKSNKSLFENFRQIYPPEKSNLCLLLNCPSEVFKQYIPNIWWGTEYKEKTLAMLESSIGEKEPEALSRARLDCSLPDKIELKDRLLHAMAESSSFDCSVIDMTTTWRINVRECDEFNLESAKAFYDVFLTINNFGQDNKEKKLSDLYDFFLYESRNNKGEYSPMVLNIAGPSDESNEHFEKDPIEFIPDDYFNVESEDVKYKEDTIGINPGQCLLRIDMTGDDKFRVVVASYKERDKQEKINTCFSDFIKMIMDGKLDANLKDTLLKSLEDYSGPKTENNEKTSIMENTSYLDKTNPASPNPDGGKLTTRQLLKELRLRGVNFDNLSITVRQEINLDEI